MAWTKKQEEAITEEGKSLLVSAAAGSGKTSVLVERIVRLIQKGIPLNRMLVVTFTNAAAAEMKERIAAKVGAAQVRHSHISTFHKFAMDVIRKYYYVIGVNPSFSICDEYKKSIFVNEAMDEMFEDMFESGDEQFIGFLDCYATAKSSENVKNLILSLKNFLESVPDSEAFSAGIASGEAFDIEKYISYAAESVNAALANAIPLHRSCIDLLLNPGDNAKPMPVLAQKLKDELADLETIKDLFDGSYTQQAFDALLSFKHATLRKSNAEKVDFEVIEHVFNPRREAVKDEIKAAKELIKNLDRSILEGEKESLKKPLSQLVYLTDEFTKRFNKKKLAAGLMDFSDIEHNALKILENKSVCDEIRDSFDCIFVDEYQDSNLVQEELISRISRPDNLFMVGDVKQSIYKFRLAEPEIFLGKYQKYKHEESGDAKVIDLNSNFRSKSTVISTVNDIFRGIMTRSSTGIDYDDDAALYEGDPYEGDKLYDSKLWIVDTQSDDDKIDEALQELKDVELEALQAVRIINEYHGKIIYDSKAKKERPLEYKDMVILLRATKNKGEVYYSALENAGIPVYLSRNEGYFNTTEVGIILDLLRIIDNFSQDLPLISVLHFPCFGFTADELAKIRLFSNAKGFGRIPYSEAFKKYICGGDDDSLRLKAKAFKDKIDFWVKKEASMPLADFLWELLFESGMAEFCKALPAGDQRFANLRAMTDKVQAFEAQNASGLFGFISYIEAISSKNAKVDTGQVSMMGEGSDTVRIMTIHKSKGLEFPFVLVAGLGSKLSVGGSDSGLSTHKDFGASIKIVEPKKGLVYKPASAAAIQNKKKEEEFAELIRVLYVACTRAKDILLFSAAVNSAAAQKALSPDKNLICANPRSASKYLDLVAPFIAAENRNFVSRRQLYLSESETGASAEAVLSALDIGFEIDESKLPLPKEEIESRLKFNYAPDAESLLKSKYSVSEMAELAREKAFVKHVYPKARRVPSFAGEDILDAAARGTAFHSVMEHIPFTADGKSPEEVSEFIEKLREKNIISEAEAKAVDPARISAFFDSEIGKRVVASSEIHKEAPFVMKTSLDGREVFVQGTIDCYFREGDEFVLLDYKSNYMNPENLEEEKKRLSENYLPQLALYKEALEGILGRKVKEAVLYLFAADDSVRL